MSTSGTYNFNPVLSDSVIEAYERCGIKASEITPDHMFSAKRSLNLLLSSWAVNGVNLWTVDLQKIPLVQGVATYSIPSNTIMILDSYIRTYPMNAPLNLTPSFTTISSSNIVTVNLASNGLVAGNYINIVIPISIGGIILLGFYQVVSATTDTFTITAANAATSSATGGAVPQFSAVASSATVIVNLPNHEFLAGQPFIVQVPVTVGGVQLTGSYTIGLIIDTDNFTITAPYPAGFTQSASENGGLAQIAVQNTTAQLIDRVMGPMSRTDYNAQPNKSQQGFPTIYWFDRLINPTVTLWEVPDGNGPYEYQYYRMRQIQDANPVNGQTAEIPQRFFEPFHAGLAFFLSIKWAADRSVALKAYYKEVWDDAIEDDREVVNFRIVPDVSSYFQC